VQGGPLHAAGESALHSGCANLYIVFKSDPIATWGSKRVTVYAGGLLFAGMPQRRLYYEVVARQIFGTVGGRDANIDCRVLVLAEMTPDPEQVPQLANDCDPFLGFAEPPNLTKMDHPKSIGLSLVLGPGCKLTWIDQTGYSEIWFVADSQGFEEHRFLLTEYARRQYVQVILTVLDFVIPPQLANSTGNLRGKALVQSHALLGGIMPFLAALQDVTSPSHSATVVKVEEANETGKGEHGTDRAAKPDAKAGVVPAVPQDQKNAIDIVELD
jgi:hypothetical protein